MKLTLSEETRVLRSEPSGFRCKEPVFLSLTVTRELFMWTAGRPSWCRFGTTALNPYFRGSTSASLVLRLRFELARGSLAQTRALSWCPHSMLPCLMFYFEIICRSSCDLGVFVRDPRDAAHICTAHAPCFLNIIVHLYSFPLREKFKKPFMFNRDENVYK